MEAGVAVLKEINDLLGSRNSGVDVRFGGLRTHFLRRSEIASLEERAELGICYRHDIRHVLEVGTLLHESDESVLVDHLLAGGVDKDSTLRHEVHQIMVNRALGLRRSGDMERNDVAGLVQFLCGMERMHVSGGHRLIGAVRIVGIDLHAEALRDTRYVTAYVSKGVNTEFLTLEFGTRSTVIEVTYGIDHESERKLCHGIAVLTRGVHRYYLMSSGRLQVDIIITGTGAHYDLQLFGCVQHGLIHHIRTDDERIGISHCIQ